jgi:hypothetical protein
MDARTFRSWARLVHRRSDHLIEDAMIAATAAVHTLTVVTRNVRQSSNIAPDLESRRLTGSPETIANLAQLEEANKIHRRPQGRAPE